MTSAEDRPRKSRTRAGLLTRLRESLSLRGARLLSALGLLALLHAPLRLPILLILLAVFLFAGPGRRWALRSPFALLGLAVLVPTLLTLAYQIMLNAGAIDFTALSPGVYVGRGVGTNPVEPLEVTAVVEPDGTLSLAVTTEDEFPRSDAVERALTELPRRIASGRSLAVESVSGATATSRGVFEAARDALGAAGGAASTPFHVEALRWLTKGELTPDAFFQLAVIFVLLLLLDLALFRVFRRRGSPGSACLGCGACAAVCPAAPEVEALPRALVDAARRDDPVLLAELARHCRICVRCTARCPNGVSAPHVAAKSLSRSPGPLDTG